MDGIHAILLIDGLAAANDPAALMLLHEIVHPPGTQDVDQDPFDGGPLADGHFGLPDRPIARYVAAKAAVEVKNIDAFIEAVATDFNKLFSRSLEPGGVHPAFGMPDGFEALPIAGVT